MRAETLHYRLCMNVEKVGQHFSSYCYCVLHAQQVFVFLFDDPLCLFSFCSNTVSLAACGLSAPEKGDGTEFVEPTVLTIYELCMPRLSNLLLTSSSCFFLHSKILHIVTSSWNFSLFSRASSWRSHSIELLSLQRLNCYLYNSIQFSSNNAYQGIPSST